MKSNKWFVLPKPNPKAKLRLFCFPYAGGSIITFMNWPKWLSNDVELVIVQPPGRGSRMFEPLFTDMDTLIDQLLPLMPNLLDLPFMFLGHSLGSRVAFELTNKLDEKKLPTPVHFIASGSPGPQLLRKKKAIYKLPEIEFIEELKHLNGTPTAVLENKELMALFLPLLRADFEIADTYRFRGDITLECGLTILGGKNDDITKDQLMSWKEFFNLDVDLKLFPGDHFFIDSEAECVLEYVNNIILQTIDELPTANATSMY